MHRRQLLAAIPAIWLAANPAMSSVRKPTIDEMVEDLNSALQALHGGEWKATIDSQHQFVMLCRH